MKRDATAAVLIAAAILLGAACGGGSENSGAPLENRTGTSTEDPAGNATPTQPQQPEQSETGTVPDDGDHAGAVPVVVVAETIQQIGRAHV